MRAVMTGAELDLLLQEVLDGTASPEQRARLESHLAAVPADLPRRRELEDVFARLRAVPTPAAPAGLREAVLARIEAPAPATRVPWIGPSRGTTAMRGSLRIALPFALGFAAGAIAFLGWAGTSGRDLGGEAVGTMMPAGKGDVERFEPGSMRVTLHGERRGEVQVLRFSARPARPADEIEIRFDPARTRLAAFRQADARQGGIEAAPGRLRLLPERDAGYVIELVHSDAGARVELAMRSGDVTAHRTLPPDFGEDR